MPLIQNILALGCLPFLVMGAPLQNNDYNSLLVTKRAVAATADKYSYYSGNGELNWPAQNQWIPSYDDLFTANVGVLRQSCSQFGMPNNSDDEIGALREAIRTVAQETQVDARYIFAITMQESNGCVRAPTTDNGVRNPGLMQDHNGVGTCNERGSVSNPCSASMITTMIREGVNGTPYGDGLVQLLARGGSDTSKYYRAARMYNSGSIGPSGDLTVGATATACYASDVANRLTGWVFSKTGCQNGQAVPGTNQGSGQLPVYGAPASSPSPSPSPKPASSPTPSPSPSPKPVLTAPKSKTTSSLPAAATTSKSSSTTSLPIASPTTTKPSSSTTTTSFTTTVNSVAKSLLAPKSSPTPSPSPAASKSYGPAPGVRSGCTKYYTIQAGDYCDKVATTNGISFAQLRQWNVQLDSGCSNLWQGYDYCVAV